MDDLDAQFASGDSTRRKQFLLMTPQERMAEFNRLQEQMWAKLRSDPEAYADFLRRNFKARAIKVPKEHLRDGIDSKNPPE